MLLGELSQWWTILGLSVMVGLVAFLLAICANSGSKDDGDGDE